MRLVACDLDGTIVRRDGTVSERTLDAFAACERAGIPVVFVTGRPPRWMEVIAEATDRRGVAICSNGALVLDLSTWEVLAVDPIPAEIAVEVARRLRRELPGAAFAIETTVDLRREPRYLPRHQAAVHAVTAPLEELVGDGVTAVKLLCRQEGWEDADAPDRLSTDAMLQVARTVLAGLAEPVHSNPRGGMLEISALGVSKASALRRFATGLGIEARDVVAFGDQPNDVAMLRWAGQGYAMADGHPEALDAADAVAPSVVDDGVARVLEGALVGTGGTGGTGRGAG